MIREGVYTFVDVGPQRQMMGLVGRILPKESHAIACSVEDLESLNEFMATMG